MSTKKKNTLTEPSSIVGAHHFTAQEFGSRAGEFQEDTGVTAETPLHRIHENIQTPEQLMLFSIFEMLKHVSYMLAKTDDDIREYALYNAFFECALANIRSQEEKQFSGDLLSRLEKVMHTKELKGKSRVVNQTIQFT